MQRFLTAVFACLVCACASTPTANSAPSASTPALDTSPSALARASGSCPSPTVAETEGPYFRAGSPERTSFVEPGMAGTRLHLTGRVVKADCSPIAGSELDFWHADASGHYDNSGYRLRGHEFTDAHGNFSLDTIVPGLYPGRTRHIHVKVHPPGASTLTTQLYFPGEARNAQDSLFNSALLLDVRDEDGGKSASFTFVLRA